MDERDLERTLAGDDIDVDADAVESDDDEWESPPVERGRRGRPPGKSAAKPADAGEWLPAGPAGRLVGRSIGWVGIEGAKGNIKRKLVKGNWAYLKEAVLKLGEKTKASMAERAAKVAANAAAKSAGPPVKIRPAVASAAEPGDLLTANEIHALWGHNRAWPYQRKFKTYKSKDGITRFQRAEAQAAHEGFRRTKASRVPGKVKKATKRTVVPRSAATAPPTTTADLAQKHAPADLVTALRDSQVKDDTRIAEAYGEMKELLGNVQTVTHLFDTGRLRSYVAMGAIGEAVGRMGAEMKKLEELGALPAGAAS